MKITRKTTLPALLISILLILSLSACGGGSENEQDENLAVTQVVETAMAAITQTAAAQSPTPNNTPTFTPAPSSTPTATSGPTPTVPAIPTQTSVFQQPSSETSTCDIGGFISDVTIPDGTQIAIGSTFTKTWKIENIGTCTWNKNYQIVFNGGTQMADDVAYRFTDEDIEPGETVEVSIDMTAPGTAGTYTSYWVFKNDVGQIFYVDGGSIYVEIAVGITPTPTATLQPNDPPTIVINTPADEAIFTTGDTITFSGTAEDPEDGDLSNSIEWRSDIDGLLGTAASLNFELSEGEHTITATVKDTRGATVKATITVYVEAPSP
ncbi:MAG: hypothetical protein JW757_03720 [Anaerolineales bacterium]|nr:hypothetical protein [Anaerolineales bacterium]